MQLVYVLFSEMTSLSSIFSYCKVNKRVPSKKDRKAWSVSDNHLWHIFINHTLESSAGQTINFLYNLNSIVNCCISPKCVTCNNVFDNDFWLIFYNSTRKACADKQVTYLLYYDVNNLTSILNSHIGPKCVTLTNDNIVSDNHFWLIFYKLTRKSSADKQVTY